MMRAAFGPLPLSPQASSRVENSLFSNDFVASHTSPHVRSSFLLPTRQDLLGSCEISLHKLTSANFTRSFDMQHIVSGGQVLEQALIIKGDKVLTW